MPVATRLVQGPSQVCTVERAISRVMFPFSTGFPPSPESPAPTEVSTCRGFGDGNRRRGAAPRIQAEVDTFRPVVLLSKTTSTHASG